MRYSVKSALVLVFCLLPVSTMLSHELHRPSLRLYNGEGVSIQLFSSLTATRFARIEIKRVSPARIGIAGSQIGLGVPGYRIVGLQVSLFPVPCSASDWEQLLDALHPLKAASASMRGGVRLRLPNGQMIFGPNPPLVQGATLLVEGPHMRQSKSETYLIERDATGTPHIAPPPTPSALSFPSNENKNIK